MKNAKIVAEWVTEKGGAVIKFNGKPSDVYTLICATVMEFFDVTKIPDSVELAVIVHDFEVARKALITKVDLDALKRAKEQRDD